MKKIRFNYIKWEDEILPSYCPLNNRNCGYFGRSKEGLVLIKRIEDKCVHLTDVDYIKRILECSCPNSIDFIEGE